MTIPPAMISAAARPMKDVRTPALRFMFCSPRRMESETRPWIHQTKVSATPWYRSANQHQRPIDSHSMPGAGFSLQKREEDVAMAKVLFVVSGATYWVLKDGTRYATGYWAEEFANPYKIVTDAGHDVVVATPNGVTPNVDMMSLRPEMAGGPQGALELEAIIRSAEEMRRPLKLSDVRLEDYDAVYLPGGHGPMADLAFDADAGRLLTAQLESGRPLFIVCHGPAAMLSTRIRGVSPFNGYRVTCFTNEEEEA